MTSSVRKYTMLKLIIPRKLLLFIDSYRGTLSRASYILRCVYYIKENNITINNEGVSNDTNENSKQRGEDTNNYKL